MIYRLGRAAVLYVVDGRQTIPPGVEVTGQKGIRIVGRNGGVLVVKGALVIHGVSGHDVQVRGVRIEPASEVKLMSIHATRTVVLRGVDLEGKTNRVYAMVHTSHLGGVRIENIADLTVRTNVLSGTPLLFRDNRTLQVLVRGRDGARRDRRDRRRSRGRSDEQRQGEGAEAPEATTGPGGRLTAAA